MSSEAPTKSTPGPRILIVDDDDSQRSLLDSFLKGQGFQTVPVASGEQALEILRAGGYAKIKLVALEGVPDGAAAPSALENPKP